MAGTPVISILVGKPRMGSTVTNARQDDVIDT